MPRPHAHELKSAAAQCQRCNWRTAGRNAQALAAQHYDKNGHRVVVELIQTITYGAIIGKTAANSGQGNLL